MGSDAVKERGIIKCWHCRGPLNGNDTFCSDECVIANNARAEDDPPVAARDCKRCRGSHVYEKSYDNGSAVVRMPCYHDGR